MSRARYRQFWGCFPLRLFLTRSARQNAVANVRWLNKQHGIHLPVALGLVGCTERQYYRWRKEGGAA
jgi:hypothetical protein